jgi:hypothetical protein
MNRLLTHVSSRFFLANLAIIMVVSLMAGHFVVTHNHRGHFFQFIQRPGYFYSVTFSAIIALILLLVIYGVSYHLFTRYGGGALNRDWVLGQMGYGVLLVIVLELAFATLLFRIMGRRILESAYFDKLFQPIVLFIIAANLCYLLYFRNREPAKVRYKFISGEIATAEGEESTTVDTPMFWYINEGDVLQVDVEGQVEVRDSSLTLLMEELDPSVYFRGARDWIIHREMIRLVTPHRGNRLKICCKVNEHHLVVSRRNATKFKVWLDQYQ